VETALQWIVPALIGLATGAAATAYKSRKDLEVQYDIKLREERIAAYKELWKELDRLAYYAAERPLTYGVAKELATALRTWYFDIGGLLMSAGTREPYFDVQRALKAVTDSGGEFDTTLPDDTAAALKQLGSRLRTSTTDDVATRVDSLLTQSLRTWLRRGRRSQALVTVTRGWRFDPEASGVWRVRVLNQSRSRPLMVTWVWLDANGDRVAEPLDDSRELPRVLYPRESWQGFVADEDGLMKGVDDPFRVGRASGPGWDARSRSGGDPPASPIPAEGRRADAQETRPA
jgi:hypothetical protein